MLGLVLWNYGIMKVLNYGIMELWNYGSMVWSCSKCRQEVARFYIQNI